MKFVSRIPEERKKQTAERESEKLISGKKENGLLGVNFIACAREANFRAGNGSSSACSPLVSGTYNVFLAIS